MHPARESTTRGIQAQLQVGYNPVFFPQVVGALPTKIHAREFRNREAWPNVYLGEVAKPEEVGVLRLNPTWATSLPPR